MGLSKRPLDQGYGKKKGNQIIPATSYSLQKEAVARSNPKFSAKVNDNINRPSSSDSASSSSAQRDCSSMESLPPQLVYNPQRIKPVDDKYRVDLVINAQVAKPLDNGWKLFPHQQKAIIHGLKMRRLVVAYDMGLGKTLIGCVWAKAFKKTFDGLKIYIIAPVTLKQNWQDTALTATGLRTYEEQKPKKKKRKLKSIDECAQVEESPEEEDCFLDISISSWAKIPQHVPPRVKNFVVICDEAHSMQSMNSGRTKDVLRLVLGPR